MTERHTVQPTEIKSPERRGRLSDEEMGNLLAAFGNNEAKALTLLLMKPETIYTEKDLHGVLLRFQGKNPGWKIDKRSPFQYCVHSLAPIGLVAKEIIDPVAGTFGYEKTEYGERVGDPFAALLLDFSLSHDLSLYQIFGSSVSSGPSSDIEVEGKSEEFRKRSPLTRVKILRRILATESAARISDIDIHEGKSVVGDHIRDLHRLNVVELKSSKPYQVSSYFKIPPDKLQVQPSPYHNYRTLTREVYGLIKSEPDKPWSIQEITDRLQPMFESNSYLRKNVTSVLSYLRKQGYLNEIGFSSRKKSDISLTPEKRSELNDLIKIIDAFQDKDPAVLARGRELAHKFGSGNMATEIAQLMQKARENSPFANKDLTGQTGEIILGILIQSSPKLASEIRELLEKNYNKNLSQASVRMILINLEKRGLLVRERGKANSLRWTGNVQAEETISEVRPKMGFV